MLVPPLDLKFKTQRREAADGREWPTELIITGHFMALVDRVGKPPRWAFDDERAEYDAQNKHAYKLAVAEAMRALGEKATVPAKHLRFLSLLA